MKTSNFGALVAAVAGSVIMTASAFAQSAQPGTCQIFVDRDYGGAAGTVVGSQPSGDVVMFVEQEQAPADMVSFLIDTVKYRVFYDPSWSEKISSVKVGPGCIAELHNNLTMKNGRVSPFSIYESDTPFIGENQNDKAKMAICRCPN